jgi:tetratricopeptide (TPR) repeat protein
LSYWIAKWQQHLLALPPATKVAEPESEAGIARQVRLGDLFMKQADVAAAADYYDAALSVAGTRAQVRYRAATAHLNEPERARAALGDLSQVSGLFGSWLGLHARLLAEAQQANDAERAWALAIAVDPLGAEAACGGYSALTSLANVRPGAAAQELPLPSDPTRRKLCEAARNIVRD